MSLSVIIPVYGALPATRRCVDSVLNARNEVLAEILVIDDGNTDPEIQEYLDELEAGRRVAVVRAPVNKGFVAAVNLGMRERPDDDIVLLNSDTEVADAWLDRLHACANRQERCGTVTPFSNNATICSFPEFCQVNALPQGWGLAQLDQLFARVNAGQDVRIPTAVGFCMYIPNRCRKAVGLFDEQNFGRGYGEENDFCMRATAMGFTHLLCADVFVYHQGGASFSAEKEARVAAAQQVLAELHPHYGSLVATFVAADPVRPFRQRVLAAMSTVHPDESFAKSTRSATAGRAND